MEYVRFGDLYSIPSSNGVSRPSAVRGEGYKMINMGELFSNDIIRDIPMERVKLSEKEKSKFLVKEGDLLFARQSLVASGAGKCSIVKELNEETTFESHLIRVRLDNSIVNPWYYYYLFQLPYNPVKTIVNQCAQAGIRGTELVKIKVPLPPIKVQNKVAETLSTYDDLIENNNKRIAILEQMAENLYQEWFVRFRFPGHESIEFENGLPKGWKPAKLRDIAKEVGKSIKKENLDGYDYYLPIDCLPNKSMHLNFADDINNAESSLHSFKKGDILFGAMRPYFHKVLRSPVDGVTRKTCFVINAKQKNYAEWLYLLLYQKSTVDFATTVSVGSTMPYVRWQDFSRMNIVLPDENTAAEFSKRVLDILNRINLFYFENENIIKQRDLLLPRLMSGKLEV